jgi:nitrite reductase/ring-hydroxylating ferredoxin subunit
MQYEPKLPGKNINENVILANKPRNSPPCTEDENVLSCSRICPHKEMSTTRCGLREMSTQGDVHTRRCPLLAVVYGRCPHKEMSTQGDVDTRRYPLLAVVYGRCPHKDMSTQGDVHARRCPLLAVVYGGKFIEFHTPDTFFLTDSTIIFPSTPDSFYDRNFIF